MLANCCAGGNRRDVHPHRSLLFESTQFSAFLGTAFHTHTQKTIIYSVEVKDVKIQVVADYILKHIIIVLQNCAVSASHC